ncbi:hypothetical protein TrRE_jg6491, partial [Triparma retinervis]
TEAGASFSNPEFDEFSETTSVTLSKSSTQNSNSSDSSWLIDAGDLCITLSKSNPGEFWPSVHSDDPPSCSAVTRDYEKVGLSLLGEVGVGGGEVQGGLKRDRSARLALLSIGLDKAKVGFTITKKDGGICDKIDEEGMHRDYDGVLCVRLSYEEDPRVEGELSMQLDIIGEARRRTQVRDLNRIRCRFCSHPLLQGREGGLKESLPLPEGFWDEISDFLACHAEESAVNFHSASWTAIKGCALEDDSVVLLHAQDCGDSLGILLVEGYGERGEEEKEEGEGVSLEDINYRGVRYWKCGGATVCCNRCCSVVGFASVEAPESLRLYKHRVDMG